MSNGYPQQKHRVKIPNYTSPASHHHSRAATYAKSKPHAYKTKTTSSASHLPSNSIAATSNATLNDIETTRSDMRDILWQNAELLQSDPNYRKKVWRYMSKVFYGNQSTAYQFDNYKKFQLPSSATSNRPTANEIDSQSNTLGVSSSLQAGLSSDANQQQQQPPQSAEESMTKVKLKLLLDRQETYSDFLINSNPKQVILMNKVRPKMERILEAYACANQNKLALSGAVQLCAVILTTFNATNKASMNHGGGGGQPDEDTFGDDHNDGLSTSMMTNISYNTGGGGGGGNSDSDCQDTFFILQILTQIMRVYYSDDEKLMKDETLLLIDVLCVNEEKLVRKLNQLEIDVIDLSVFVSSWIRCLFVHHFEIEFVQRVIDLVLLEGPSVLIAIVYGILQFIKNDILQCHTHYDVFEKLAGSKLKNYLKKDEFIHRVIQKAQLLFTEENYKYVIKGREKKSWPDLLGLPGQKHFRIEKGIGDKTKVKRAYQHWRRESRNHLNSAYWGADESSDDSDEEEDHNGNGGLFTPNHHGRDSSMGFRSGTFEMDGASSGVLKNKLHELETKLAAANEKVQRLQQQQHYHDPSHIHGINAIPEEVQIGTNPDLPPSSSPRMETHGSLVMHENDDSSPKKKPSPLSSKSHKKTSSSGRSHSKAAPTLSEILYTSEHGETIYQEPLTDDLAPREIQCRTENWTDSWKHALNSLTDASISMQGYLVKMTASKWNSRGTLDKVQRRWFVLRGNYMTYYKTNLHTQPKSDKCVNLLGYKVNPVVHSKSKYAFELISPPKENLHKKSKSRKKQSMGFGSQSPTAENEDNYNEYPPGPDSPSAAQRGGSNTQINNFYERTKFVLIPDLDVDEAKQREIRDKWVKSLRLATKGAFLWDVLLNLQVETNGGSNGQFTYPDQDGMSSSSSHHSNSQTAFVHSSAAQALSSSTGSSSYSNLNRSHGGRGGGGHKQQKGGHRVPRHHQVNSGPPSMSSSGQKHGDHHDKKGSNEHHFQYTPRQYGHHASKSHKSHAGRRVGGNTQDYPDYR